MNALSASITEPWFLEDLIKKFGSIENARKALRAVVENDEIWQRLSDLSFMDGERAKVEKIVKLIDGRLTYSHVPANLKNKLPKKKSGGKKDDPFFFADYRKNKGAKK